MQYQLASRGLLLLEEKAFLRSSFRANISLLFIFGVLYFLICPPLVDYLSIGLGVAWTEEERSSEVFEAWFSLIYSV